MPKNLRVLVVDDSEEICCFLKQVLAEAQFDVETKTNPVEALAELSRATYHMVILDLKMKEMSGEEMLRKIREFDKEVCIVIYTGYPSVDSAVEAVRQDASDYIQKPCKPAEIVALLRRIASEKGMLLTANQMLNGALGKKIRELRKKKDMTLRQLSNKTGLSVSLISQIELAKTSASLSTLHKISCALGTVLSDLFAGIE